ncbi:methyltransferase domain-containing protein [Streptomyces solisilvae]|uniref:SAM-dependent methyltransferase n=1 Tax=Streptomyces malaysiensis TaxID=92644 RepID=UPI00331EAC27
MTTSVIGKVTRDVLEIGRAIRVVAAPPAKRVQRLYELLYHQSNLMGDETSYVNMGYWPRESMTIDEASQALADLVADAGEFGSGDRILDVGFGYGDQDFRWLETCKPEKIVGVNVTPGQVRAARERARAESATRHLEFREGVATALPFPDETFDKVVALESAFHFSTRDQFFAQAFRVLRPGGLLVTADVIPFEVEEKDSADPEKTSGIVPKANWYTRDVYAERLNTTGFHEVDVRSIREHVWEPWRLYMSRKAQSPAFRSRAGIVYRTVLRRGLRDGDKLKSELAKIDYVVAVARKKA